MMKKKGVKVTDVIKITQKFFEKKNIIHDNYLQYQHYNKRLFALIDIPFY